MDPDKPADRPPSGISVISTAPANSDPTPKAITAEVSPALNIANPSVKSVSTHKRLKIGIVVAAGLMVISSASAYVIASRDSLSNWDILAASNSAQDLSSEVSRISTQVNAMQTASSLPDFYQISTTLDLNITDAEKQYTLLQSSPVQKNRLAASKFLHIRQMWGAYATYVQGISRDYKTLGPVLVQLNTVQQAALANSQKASASLEDELAGYASSLNTVSQEAASLQMQTSPDKQLLSNLKTYISNTGNVTNAVKVQLASRSKANTISSDVTSIAALAATFSNNETAWEAQSYTQLQKLSPTNAISAFNSNLDSLSKTTLNN